MKHLNHLAAACVVLLLSASSCLDDAAKGGTTLIRSEGDGLLAEGAKRADDLLARVPQTARPTLGTRLATSATRLSDDPRVQSAAEGVAWEATCALAFNQVPRDPGAVAAFLVQRAVGFGIEFLGDGAQELAESVVDAFDESESEAEDACNALSSL